jgi:hypothetical protein
VCATVSQGSEDGDAYTARVGRTAAVPGGHPDQAARPPRQAQGGGTALHLLSSQCNLLPPPGLE